MTEDTPVMAKNPPIEIRELAVPQDGMDLVALLWHKGPPWVEDIRRRIQGEVACAADHFFAAFCGGRMVATAWYTLSQEDPKLGLIGHIYTWPEHRRRGISTRLVQAAMADFRERGGVVMQLFTSTPYTVPLYERLGFENLYASRVYHETDWAMRYPAGCGDLVASWFRPSPCRIRPLVGGDLPQYCLLYNLEYESVLKDWAQSIGLGLEAEFAMLNSLEKMSKGEGVCLVLENEQTIVGIAGLVRASFPHHSHVAAVDFYVHPAFASKTAELVGACLARREEVGAEIVYAMRVDEPKRGVFERLGFRTKAVLPRHYKVRDRYFDGELFEETST